MIETVSKGDWKGLFLVDGVLLIMTEHKFSRELDHCAEYCTLSKYFVSPGGYDT